MAQQLGNEGNAGDAVTGVGAKTSSQRGVAVRYRFTNTLKIAIAAGFIAGLARAVGPLLQSPSPPVPWSAVLVDGFTFAGYTVFVRAGGWHAKLPQGGPNVSPWILWLFAAGAVALAVWSLT